MKKLTYKGVNLNNATETEKLFGIGNYSVKFNDGTYAPFDTISGFKDAVNGVNPYPTDYYIGVQKGMDVVAYVNVKDFRQYAIERQIA